jgi:hypothetical protein
MADLMAVAVAEPTASRVAAYKSVPRGGSLAGRACVEPLGFEFASPVPFSLFWLAEPSKVWDVALAAESTVVVGTNSVRTASTALPMAWSMNVWTSAGRTC